MTVQNNGTSEVEGMRAQFFVVSSAFPSRTEGASGIHQRTHDGGRRLHIMSVDPLLSLVTLHTTPQNLSVVFPRISAELFMDPCFFLGRKEVLRSQD